STKSEKRPGHSEDSSSIENGSVDDSEQSKQVTSLSNNSETERSQAEHGAVAGNPGIQQPVSQSKKETSKGSAPSVKLDLDLDVEIELKAKIQGDLELAIL
ncbi:hypothetical protein FZEAL_10542, partial [Fusarium zealandicum]